MSAPGSSRLSSPPSFSKDDSHTILHRMPRNGNPRDLFSCLFGALPFSPAAISLYLPVYSCQARPLLIIYGIIIPDDCQCLCFLPVKSENVNIKIDIFSCFYRFAILHNTQPVLLYIFTFRQRSSKAATAASLSRSLYPLLCKLLYLFLE